MKIKSKLLKKMGAAALGLTMALSLAACGGGTDGGGATGSPADIMKTAQKNLADVKSMSYQMNMDMEMTSGGQTVNMLMAGQADYIIDPMKMKMDMVMDMGELGSMNTKMYMEQKDDSYVVYTGMDDGTGNITWSSQTMDGVGSLEQYDAQATMDMYLSSSDNFVENTQETINNTETTRYDGVITNDALNKVLTSSGVLSQFASMGLDDTEMESMLTDLGDLPISIWVDDKTTLPLKYKMDMTQIMQSLMTKMTETTADAPEISIGKVNIEMTMSNINGVDSIEIPEEAMNATPAQ